MSDKWQNDLNCALVCMRCNESLKADDRRILSVYDHQPICMDCKKKEEERADYAQVSQQMIGTCLDETERRYSDPGGYCFYHFYPFKC